MKIRLIIALSCLFSLKAITQNQPNKQGTFFQLNLNAIEVKDSSGAVYPTDIVRQLISSGKFGLRLAPDHKTAVLIKYSAEELSKRAMGMPAPVESKFFKTGEKIASFNEKDINGNKYNLKELTGKVVVLNFWFINCPPCRKEIPDLNELVELFKDNKEVVFIAVALDAKYEIKEFLKTTPFMYNIIHDGRYIAQKYNINSFPTHLVLNKQGKVAFHTSGLAMNTVSSVKTSIETSLNETVRQQ